MNDARSNWHAQPAEEVVKRLSTFDGLTQEQAEERLKKEGKNKLPEPKQRGIILRFLFQFHNVLIYLLLLAAGITFLIHEYIDSTVILGVVLINALIGFLQEGKAEKALHALRKLLSLDATVIRNGVKKTISAEDLVCGDIVVLSAGDKVPADIRLISAHDIRAEEGILTGESGEQEKSIEQVPTSTVLADRTSMVYSGTSITYGSGTGVVVATGLNTEVGKITTMLTQVTKLMTPLLKKMQVFARWLTLVILGAGVFAFLFGYFAHTYAINELFMASVSLVVAAIPEGLPAIMTITLAVGVTRMARKKAIIRHLPSVETMGSVTIICTDKTGTLTRNELSVQHVLTPQNKFWVSGEGYSGKGKIFIGKNTVEARKYEDLMSCIVSGMLCNDAELREDDEWHVEGTPLDGALLAFGLKAGVKYQEVRGKNTRLDVIPFDSANKFMAVLIQKPDKTKELIIKGAPEIILNFCDLGSKNDYWENQLIELANQGNRVIAIAKKRWISSKTTVNVTDIKSGFEFLGMLGLIDPPREESTRAVKKCLDAGISVMMITGDHALTAKNIASQVGIKGEILTGHDLEKLSDEELTERISNIAIFARTTPEHKLRIVNALQKKGHIVAMTGDGVNDAPALKRADIGIAMGIKGTDVSKEISDMVLVDDNFASIERAVAEGRTVYDNLKKAITYILPINAGEAMAMVIAVMFGLVLPIMPLQILWINMVTTVVLDLSMAFGPIQKEIMKRPPRKPDAPLFEPRLIWRVTFLAFLVVMAVFGFFLWEQFHGVGIDESRTVVVNAIVFLEIMYLINCQRITSSAINKKAIFGNRAALISIFIVILLQLVFTYTPVMQYFFSSTPIGGRQWLAIIAVSLIFFLLVELEKSLVWKSD